MNSKKSDFDITVIIPVYNTEKYIEECICSISRETLINVEIVIIDDGSWDNSISIAERIAEINQNIVLYHQENKGLSAARNKGLELAKGKYIIFLDSDDYLEAKYLKELYDVAEADNLDVLFYDANVKKECLNVNNTQDSYDRTAVGIDENRVYTGRDFFNVFYPVGGVYVSACLQMIKKTFLIENEISFQEGVFFEDNEFLLKVLLRAIRVKYFKKKIYTRRLRENSIMTQNYTKNHVISAICVSEACLQYLINSKSVYENDYALRQYQCALYQQVAEVLKKSAPLENKDLINIIEKLTIVNEKVITQKFSVELAIYYRELLQHVISRCKTEFAQHNRRKQEDQIAQVEVVYEILGGLIKKTVTEIGKKIFNISENTKIGLYGVGEVAAVLVGNVFMEIPNVDKKVLFIKTNCEKGEKFWGKYRVVSLGEVENYPIASIIILSSKYGMEMTNCVKEYYGERYKIYNYKELGNEKVTFTSIE